MSGPPRLSVSTGFPPAGPSTPAPPRRPQGARSSRRGAHGLYVANPDNSDSDTSPRASPVRGSPVTASSTGSGGRSVIIPGSAISAGMSSSSSMHGRTQAPTFSSYNMAPSASAPTVPAPNTPLPNPFPSPVPTGTPSMASVPNVPGYPSYPPPQPKRHFTTPIPALPADTRPHESRHSSLSGAAGHRGEQPHSPTRHLPPLPSPSSSHSAPLPPLPHHHSEGSRPINHLLRTGSPEDALSPATASDGGRSLASGGSYEGRGRSGSVQSHRVLLQVTMDNEQFILVDITGMNTADGIKERVFSKLRLRDDDHSSLMLYRTEIGDLPEPEPVSQDHLLQLCLEYGDAKATLKFLVVQTKPSGSAAAIVPPMAESRQLPPINTQVGPNRNSRDGGSSATTSERIDQWSEASHPDSTSASSYDNSRRSMKSIPSSSSRSLHDALNQSPSRSSPTHPVGLVSVAGPSRPRSPMLGLGGDDGMDAATRALIESIQKEDEDARLQQQARRRQMEADEKLAREAQQSERDVWQAMQQLELEGSRRRQEQIERDEQRAREVEAEERRLEEDRVRQERQPSSGRSASFFNDRREIQNQWMQMPQAQTPSGTWNLPSVEGPPPFGHERQSSEGRREYTSPVSHYEARVPEAYPREEGYRGHSGTLPRQPRRHPYGYEYGGASLQNARSMDNLRPFPNSPYPGPQRAAHTPQPYYPPQPERSQDGRYPDIPHSAPNPHLGSVPFPSPRPNRQSSGDRYQYDDSSPRPNTYYDTPGSPRTAGLPRRPSTVYNDTSPGRDEYYPPGADVPYFARRGSLGPEPVTRPPEDMVRRTSDSDVPDRESLLPYRDARWPGIRAGRNDTSDTVSVAGTVSSGFSESTIRAPPRDGDSNETAHAGDIHSQWRAMVSGRGPSVVPRSAIEDDEEEATLWITAPKKPDSPRTLTSPTRPNLTISTNTPADSATESEGEGPMRVHRTKSFAKPKNDWHFRPEPEQLYDNLDALFPKIDLDKPIVENDSTPTTPADGLQPPPVHPTRQNDSRLPQSPRVDKDKEHPPPPAHPAVSKFNKAENRKSIRSMAQGALKHSTIARDIRDKVFGKSSDDKKAERRKSSSMWGHRVVEVTPSKLAGEQPTIPESPQEKHDLHDEQEHEEKPAILNWVKGELIGKGSYGRVYIALNVSTGDMMAVKQVELPATERDRHDSRQLGMIEALRGEIALLKDLYHPNIVQYLGTETSTEYLSIFLEYVPGGTIASIYRAPDQSPFEEQLVKFFTKQILEGLAYLHGKQIMHRDLKGDNILVDANGICKISDFGISKQAADAYDSFGAATNMKGSIFWMAPEVIHSATERTYSGKVDIWSLGCVVVEMITGQRPWGALEQVAAMMKLFQEKSRPPLPRELESSLSSTALDFLNAKCLAKEPRDRPTAKELLQHRFIMDVDRSWTFATSKIGKAVASRGARKLKQHAANTSTS